MRYRVRHTTRYEYGSRVDLAAHYLHLRPRALPHQRVLTSALDADPAPGRVADDCDYFGNPVTWMFLDRAHPGFAVTAESEVDVGFPAPPDAGATASWETIARDAFFDREAAQFLFDSPFVPADAGARAYAAESFPPGRPALAGLLDLNARIARDFAFRAGVTSIATPVSEVLSRRAGVCQDFSHLMICGLRGLGLPARYVSGYVRTRPPPGQPRRRGADQSHAWVGAWLGARDGWVGLDPTNALVVRDEHVVLGWGRDYGDVSPARGVILGGGAQRLFVAVDLEAL